MSQLGLLLRSAGIFSLMLLGDERAKLTEGKCYLLDNQQRKVLKTRAEQDIQNLLL